MGPLTVLCCVVWVNGERGLFFPVHFLRSKKAPILPDRLPSCSVAMNFLHPRICRSVKEAERGGMVGAHPGKGTPMRVKCLISLL